MTALRRLAVMISPLVAALAIAAGSATAHSAVSQHARLQFANQTRIVGALPAERRLLRALLVELGPTRIRRIGIKPIVRPARYGLPSDAIMLTVSAGTSVRGLWEAYLVVGRYTAEAWRLHLRKPGKLRVGDGTTRPRPVRVSSVRVHLAAALRIARAADAELVEVRRPFGALVLTVRTNDPATFLKYDAARFLMELGSRPSTYWAVEDGKGAVVYAGGTLPGVGMMSARPDLDSCGPIMHSHLMGSTQPPCPA